MANSNFSSFAVESPQEVMQRLQTMRSQAMATNNPMLAQQAVLGNVFDSIFGNPEVKRAKQIQDRVQQAVANVPEGADDMQTQMAQLMATRDALVDAGDLSTASKVNMQMLQLGQMQMEQRRLKADTARLEGEEARDQAQFPIDMQNKLADANEYENWVNLETGHSLGLHEADIDLKQLYQSRGYQPMGKPTITGTKADVLGLTKPVLTDLQTALQGAREQQMNLRTMHGLYDPSFTTWGTRLLNQGITNFEKLGGEIPADKKAKYAQYMEWRSSSLDAANRYVKYITGAQMSQFEIKRIMAVVPTPTNGDTEFRSKLRQMMRIGLQAEKRAAIALQNGLQKLTGDEIVGMLGPLEQFEVSEAEIDAALGFSGEQANTPARSLSDEVDSILKGTR